MSLKQKCLGTQKSREKSLKLVIYHKKWASVAHQKQTDPKIKKEQIAAAEYIPSNWCDIKI